MRSLSFIVLIALLILNARGQPSISDVYTIGFSPEVDGFGFANWGGGLHTSGVTAVEMQRMFGDRVFSSTAGGKSVLSPPAKAWMDEANKAMQFGHCEGMAVLCTLMYFHRIAPGSFGAGEADRLSLSDEPLQREIAYWWATQATSPGGSQKVKDSPNAVLDTLINAFKDGRNATEWLTLGIYKPDGSGGHAMTPFAVDNFANGTANILVYDNNFPKLTRYVVVDRKNNTWSYTASVNPNKPSALYTGNASTQSLEVVTIPPRLVQQRCDFCEDNTGASLNRTKGALAGQGRIQFWVDGNASLLISDESGRRTGFVGPGQFVTEIPNSTAQSLKFLNEPWTIDQAPVITVPQTVNVSAKLTAFGTADPDMTAIGPNYVVQAQNLALYPGEEVTLLVTPSGNTVNAVLSTPKQGAGSLSSSRTATLVLGINTPAESFVFTIQGAAIEAGAMVGVQFDPVQGTFAFDTNGVSSPGTLTYTIERTNSATGEQQIFASNEISLQEGSKVTTNLNSYDGTSYSVTVQNGNQVTSLTLQDNPSLHGEGGPTGQEGESPGGGTGMGTIQPPVPLETRYNNGTRPTMHIVARYI